MERVCFVLQVKPERVDEYRETHQRVWPEMLKAIERSGRRNYSLFLRPDGLLVGYYESDDPDASTRALAADPDTAAWEEQSRGFFDQLGAERPDQAAQPLHEVFQFDEQLRQLS